jgi:hypothetical protein
MRFAGVVVVGALALPAVAPQPAAAAGTPIGGIKWALELDRGLPGRVLQGCVLISGLGWPESGAVKGGGLLYATDPGHQPASGTWSPATAAGNVVSRGDALLFDTLRTRRKRGMGTPIKLANIGLEFARGRVYLTGQVRKTKTQLVAAAPRQRLAVFAHPRLLSGNGRANGKPVPDTFLFAMQGRATLTKALAGAIERARCKGRESNSRGHLRAGAPFGRITAQLLPTAATGIGGTVDTALDLYAGDDTPIAVTPSGGPTTVSSDGDSYLHYVLPAGTQTPLACIFGLDCTPASGGFALPGQLALSYAGRTTVVAGIAVTYTLPSVHRSIPTITGTLDGAPLTIAAEPNNTNPPLSPDFLAHVSAALGTAVTGSVRHIDLHFTATGPVT